MLPEKNLQKFNQFFYMFLLLSFILKKFKVDVIRFLLFKLLGSL